MNECKKIISNMIMYKDVEIEMLMQKLKNNKFFPNFTVKEICLKEKWTLTDAVC